VKLELAKAKADQRAAEECQRATKQEVAQALATLASVQQWVEAAKSKAAELSLMCSLVPTMQGLSNTYVKQATWKAKNKHHKEAMAAPTAAPADGAQVATTHDGQQPHWCGSYVHNHCLWCHDNPAQGPG
jgi:hypothetical protein